MLSRLASRGITRYSGRYLNNTLRRYVTKPKTEPPKYEPIKSKTESNTNNSKEYKFEFKIKSPLTGLGKSYRENLKYWNKHSSKLNTKWYDNNQGHPESYSRGMDYTIILSALSGGGLTSYMYWDMHDRGDRNLGLMALSGGVGGAIGLGVGFPISCWWPVSVPGLAVMVVLFNINL